jgi:DNA repair exonuclease SbcCD ATPase subunit
MAQQAKITSVEAIEAFRANLVVYLSETQPLLEEITKEAVRTKLWLQTTQRQIWENELRRRWRKLEEARQELFNAQLANQAASSVQYMAVQRAKMAVEEAEKKMGAIRRWDRELENSAAPLTRQVDQFQGFLKIDMGRAIMHLDQILRTLDAYQNVKAPTEAASPNTPPPEPEPEEPQ